MRLTHGDEFIRASPDLEGESDRRDGLFDYT